MNVLHYVLQLQKSCMCCGGMEQTRRESDPLYTIHREDRCITQRCRLHRVVDVLHRVVRADEIVDEGGPSYIWSAAAFGSPRSSHGSLTLRSRLTPQH